MEGISYPNIYFTYTEFHLLTDCLSSGFCVTCHCASVFSFILFLIFLTFDFRERGRRGEREGEKHRCKRETSIVCLLYVPQTGPELTTQACALTGNRNSDLSVCRMAQPTEPHQPLCCTLQTRDYFYNWQFVHLNPLHCFTPSNPLPSDNHQNGLCIWVCFLFCFVHLLSFLDSTWVKSHSACLSLSDLFHSE